MKRSFTLFALVTLALLSYALYEALIAAPTEQTMGEVQRIFYYHVSSAWTSFLLFFLNFVFSVIYLLQKRSSLANATKADALALATAEVGVVFCTVVLITGPIWAKPVWGIWWAWGDVRLITTLVLWLLYVSYLMLRRFALGEQTATLAAALAIFAFIDVPIVYMAIRWWRTQHPQPVILGASGSGIDPAMMHALLINWMAFTCFAALLVWLRYVLERTTQEVRDAEVARSMGWQIEAGA